MSENNWDKEPLSTLRDIELYFAEQVLGLPTRWTPEEMARKAESLQGTVMKAMPVEIWVDDDMEMCGACGEMLTYPCPEYCSDCGHRAFLNID